MTNNFLAGSLALVLFGSLGLGGQSAMAWLIGIPERSAQQRLAENAATLARCANKRRISERMRSNPQVIEWRVWGDDVDLEYYVLVEDTASPELRERRNARRDKDEAIAWHMLSAIGGQGASGSQPWAMETPIQPTERKTRRRK